MPTAAATQGSPSQSSRCSAPSTPPAGPGRDRVSLHCQHAAKERRQPTAPSGRHGPLQAHTAKSPQKDDPIHLLHNAQHLHPPPAGTASVRTSVQHQHAARKCRSRQQEQETRAPAGTGSYPQNGCTAPQALKACCSAPALGPLLAGPSRVSVHISRQPAKLAASDTSLTWAPAGRGSFRSSEQPPLGHEGLLHALRPSAHHVQTETWLQRVPAAACWVIPSQSLCGLPPNPSPLGVSGVRGCT